MLFAVCFGIFTGGVRAAAAQDVDESSRAAARNLGYEGVDMLEKGDAAGASERLERAYQVLKVPSIGLWSARALAARGKWVEASDRYLELSRLPSSGEVSVQDAAKADAARERDALVARIPSLLVAMEPAPSRPVKVQLDGVEIPSALLGVARPTNPGSHVVVTELGERREIALREGESLRVVLSGAGTAARAQKPLEPAKVPDGAKPQGASSEPGSGPRPTTSPLRTAGFVSLAVAGAGLATWGIAGVVAIKKKDSLSSYCHDNACEPPAHSGVDTYNTLRTVSSIGFIAAIAAGAAGTTLLLIAPRPQRHDLALRAGPGQLELTGAF